MKFSQGTIRILVATVSCHFFCAVPVLAQPAKSTPKSHAASSRSGLDHEPSGPLKDIRNMDDLSQWSTYYYLYPTPDLTVKAMFCAEREGMFEKETTQPVLVALFSKIFSQNPTQLSSWVDQMKPLKPDSKALVWQALRLANTVESKEAANSLRQQFAEGHQPPVISNLSPDPKRIEEMALNPPVLDMLWASFLVTGESQYVERIISALPGMEKGQRDVNKLLTGGAARWSLTSNAAQHKRVMSICIEARERHPELKAQLDEIIARAKAPSSK